MKSLIDNLDLFEKYIKSMSLGEIEIKQKIELYENKQKIQRSNLKNFSN